MTLLVVVDLDISPGSEPRFHRNSPGRFSEQLAQTDSLLTKSFLPFPSPNHRFPSFPAWQKLVYQWIQRRPGRRSFRLDKAESDGSDHLPQPPHTQQHDRSSLANPAQASPANFPSPPAATPRSPHCTARNTQDCSRAEQMIQLIHRLWR